jgi:hypothetical protein
VVLAAVVAFALWWASRPLYEPLLTNVTAVILRVTERSAATDLHYGEGVVTVFRAGLRDENAGTIRPSYLTFNLILFLTLAFATARRPLNRWLLRFGIALTVICAIHLLALWVAAKTMIVMTAAAQGRGEIALGDNILFGIYQGYSVIGGPAVAFAVWWLALRSTPADGSDLATI